MDRSKFTDRATGEIVRINRHPGIDWAFVPAQVPPRWTFDPVLWPLLAEAREALGTLNGIGQTLPDPQLLLRPLQNREAIASSSIEGTFVTPQQLLIYEVDPKEPKTSSEKRADWKEVWNYAKALQTGAEMLSTQPVSNHVITGIHSVLMSGVRGKDKSPGKYRSQQVQIGSSGRFIPPPCNHVEGLMQNLNEYVNSDSDNIDALIKSFIAHYQFKAIHPFADGNGRVGRVLLALMIQKWLGHSHPWLYLSAYFEQYKDEYIDNLFKVSADGAWTQWLEFCLRGTVVQARDAVKRCNLLQSLRKKFHGRVKNGTSRTHKIIESLFTNSLLTITSLAKRFDVSYPTARADIAVLEEASIVKELGDMRPKSFYSAEIIRIAYSDEFDAVDDDGEITVEPSDEQVSVTVA